MSVKFKLAAVLLFIGLYFTSVAQVTNLVVLDSAEIVRLKKLISESHDAGALYDSIARQAAVAMNQQPRPLRQIHYEGLLDTDPKRINTVQSFDDINNTAALIYAGYGSDSPKYGEKIRDIVYSWAKTYRPDGNTINENKFIVFFWGYYLYKELFPADEQQVVESWINEIAQRQMNRESTPNNNWEAKRLKIIGLAGIILKNDEYVKHSAEGFRKYISTAYFSDGTSNDLRTRDALHYHVSGMVPCIAAFINLSRYSNLFDLFGWESESGSSIRKSVEYTLPYATGKQQRQEWVNTKVELDKKRAEAGIEKYRPGKLFDPRNAWEMFQWASYYNQDWYQVFEQPDKERYTSSWIGLLNSPVIRGN